MDWSNPHLSPMHDLWKARGQEDFDNWERQRGRGKVGRRFLIEGLPPWTQEWPDPGNAYSLNKYDYFQSYVLVCPECASLWCRSECSATQGRLTAVRARWCAKCLPAYVEYQHHLFSGLMVCGPAPGTVLSFDDHLASEGGDHHVWERCLLAMPPEAMWREVRLWCAFDAMLNPQVPT